MIEHNGETFLTTTEARKIIGVSNQTFYELIKSGRLEPFTIVGNKNYFRKQQVEQVKTERFTPKPKNLTAALVGSTH